jgi:uncharacterized protein YkwD
MSEAFHRMTARASHWLGLLIAPALLAAPTELHAGAFEDAVLVELNRVRAHPQAYAHELRREQVQARHGDETGEPAQDDPDDLDEAGIAEEDPEAVDQARMNEAQSDTVYETTLAQEDPAAVDDAIDYLMRQRPLPPLAGDGRLAAAAREHVARQGPTGAVGHGPPGSMGRRLQSEGVYAGLEAESISYGQRDPRDVVRQLIVDSGVPDRGHRKDLLSGGFQAAGVGCGRHARYGSMCVVDLAGAVVQR